MLLVIVSLKGKFAEAVVAGKAIKGFPSNLLAIAERKMQAVENAHVLADLRSPPGNRLEALKGSRAGQHSIRINEQWRICFVWTEAGAEHVEIVDYH
jgi:proteic killer suppression protein